VDRIHVRYEDAVTDPQLPLVLGVVIDSVKCQPCSEACCSESKVPVVPDETSQGVLQQTSARMWHYLIAWEGLAVYLNPGTWVDIAANSDVSAGESTLPAPTNWTNLDINKVQVILAPSNGRVSFTRTCALLFPYTG
jgi:hypothetical protein